MIITPKELYETAKEKGAEDLPVIPFYVSLSGIEIVGVDVNVGKEVYLDLWDCME